MAKHDKQGGLSGILGGLFFLLFSVMHFAAHGLDASPDHNVILGISQDHWFALGLIPYPLQIYAFLAVLRGLRVNSRPLPRLLLWVALLGLGISAVGHGFLSVPYTGDWRTAPTERIGWSAYLLGHITFALSALAGALSLPSTAGRARLPVGVLGALLLSSFPLALLDANDGFEFTMAPTLLYGLGWVWLGMTLLNQAPRAASLKAA